MNFEWNYWPITRIFKLIFTILFIVYAVTEKQWFFLFPALFFGIQAITNTGCGCGSQGCEVKTPVSEEKTK